MMMGAFEAFLRLCFLCSGRSCLGALCLASCFGVLCPSCAVDICAALRAGLLVSLSICLDTALRLSFLSWVPEMLS